jgi:hypothetical protein
MTKAELRAAYIEARDDYMSGANYTNQYALYLDTMLSNYFGLPLISELEDKDLGEDQLRDTRPDIKFVQLDGF